MIVVDGALDWAPFEIPGSTLPVSLVRLHSEPDTRAQSLLVRFPAGWERPETGHYEAAEELVVLDGALEMSGETYEPRDWAWFPAGFRRVASRSPAGMLAFARFDGPARWVASGEEGPPAMRARLDASGGASLPFGGEGGRLLRSGDEDSAWFGDPPAAGASAPVDCEAFDLSARAWVFTPAGEPFPAMVGPCFVRVKA